MTPGPDGPVTEDLESLVGRIADECQERLGRGEAIDVEAYARRHPEIAGLLRDVLPALGALGRPTSPTPRIGITPDAGPPAALGEYKIIREIGRGGMGVVYEAVQEPLGRHVALKVLPQWAGTDVTLVERFRRETRAVARLHHTNIVPVFGVGEYDGRFFYAMQYIRGRPLDAVLRELRIRASTAIRRGGTPDAGQASALADGLLAGRFAADVGRDSGAEPGGSNLRPIPISAATTSVAFPIGGPSPAYYRAVARVGLQVAEALAFAHGQGIVHRDIKPANLLLDDAGTVWVTDFGLAKAEGLDDLTETGDVIGTLRYMPPERLRGHSDASGDVYSLGLTLYELLTLRPAFDAPDRAQLVTQIAHQDPPRPRIIEPRIPRDLETAVLTATAKESSRRYPSAAALAEDLRRFLADRPVAARRISSAERVWRWCRRNPAVAGLLATVVGVSLLGTGVSTTFAVKAAAETKVARQQAAATARQFQRAESNFQWAQEAVQELLTQASTDMADMPQMDPVRRQLLEKALKLHQEFLRDRADDPDVRLAAARAHLRMSDTLELLGRRSQGVEALHSARALLEQVDPNPRTRFEQQKELAYVHLQLAHLSLGSGRFQEAEPLGRKSLDLHDRLRAAAPDDLWVRFQSALGWHFMGNLFQYTNRFAESEDAFQNCLRYLEYLPQDNHRYRNQRAATLNSLGVLRSRTNPEAAEEAFRGAEAALHQLIADFPQRRHHRQYLAGIDSNRGIMWSSKSSAHLLEAVRAFRRALDVMRQLERDYPGVPSYRMTSAAYQFNLGQTLQTVAELPDAVRYRGLLGGCLAALPGPAHALPFLVLGPEEQTEQAVQAFRAARTIQEGLVAEFGGRADVRSHLALYCRGLGTQLNAMRRFEEAGEALGRSRALAEQLVAEAPAESDYRDALAESLSQQASRMRSQGQMAESLPLSRLAVEHRRAALKINPLDADYQRLLQDEYAVFAGTVLRCGDHVQAARVAADWVAAFPKHGPTHRQAARSLAGCVPLAKKDQSLLRSSGAELVDTYATTAVRWLRTGVALERSAPGLQASALQKDQALDPLRAHPDFEKLLAELLDRAKPSINNPSQGP